MRRVSLPAGREKVMHLWDMSSSAGGRTPGRRGGRCIPVATAGREGWSSKEASMSREGCWWVGVERQNLVGARSNLCPRRDYCSQCTWFAVDDHRCTGPVVSQKSHSLSSDPPQGAGRGLGACLPLQPSSPQNKLELQRRFSKSVGGQIQVLAGKHS